MKNYTGLHFFLSLSSSSFAHICISFIYVLIYFIFFERVYLNFKKLPYFLLHGRGIFESECGKFRRLSSVKYVN